jgi:intracellular multiplication protein IcmG
MVDENNDVEYQLSDDDETVYEPEEEHHRAGGSPEESKPPKKPSKKRFFIGIIVVIVVIFVSYRLIRFISARREVKPVTAVAVTKKPLQVVVKPTSKQIPTFSEIQKVKQLQQKNVTAMEDLKKQQSGTQTSLEGFHQRMSSIDNRIDNLQGLTKNMASQVKEVQQTQQKQQQARKAMLARRARAKAARIRQLRRKKSYFVQAVIPGRAWLRGADGSAITIIKGDKIPGYGQVVAIDPYSGVVAMSSGIKLRYGVN